MGWRRIVNLALNRYLPGVRLPIRVSPGLWWLAQGDSLDNQLFQGTFEIAERAVFRDLIRPGMTVLDIGANAGLYAMTAAILAGPHGRVIAFEPSARERARLGRHLALNRITNVTIEPFALGERDAETDFYVADRTDSVLNSRVAMPGVSMTAARVPMVRLDSYLARAGLDRVDVVKLDVEGSERDVLRGAETCFLRSRPLLMCELEPARTLPWGYAPGVIFDLVASWRYEWLAITRGGLKPLAGTPATFTGNYLARPL